MERTTTMVVVGITRDVEQGTGEQVLAFRIGEENRKLAGEGEKGERVFFRGDSWRRAGVSGREKSVFF